MTEPVRRTPLLLALDTSTAMASLALFDGEGVLAESTWLAGREHSTQLLAEIDGALRRVGRQPMEVTGVAVAVGPGSFTGVRVAVSLAKGFAAGLGIPVWGVSTLEVLARSVGWADSRPVRAVLDAGRGRVATACFARGRQLGAVEGVRAETILSLDTDATLVVGDIPAELRRDAVHADRLASPAASLRRAGFLAEAAWERLKRGEPGDAVGVDAVYLQR